MPARRGQRCRIRVKGQLAPEWSAWFDGLTVTQDAEGVTTISGRVADQSALYGLLARVQDLGLTLLSVSAEEAAPRRGVPSTQPKAQ
jgi:hypothetical protein